ncbi:MULTISPECIES: 23S rRNA (pseudouridine(1915)-N(3))-methyltransferase RlmH [Pseudoxanthomonas]|jgi:23S rRNA (pseudouridine1915-N3)-methyltransferase|uniref:Ribosomal RNA large subunit methyltransferase H n=1 Tax=Pseudoxanthomonas winnipegensis TaxID=2480810 RepID=A0A4Q8L6B8_9GAMM|nr:23S rRNA (pseudouridine(1915)-N(3))-methyltransferase RlmH [Pseudoxanthomonas winnipegensis]RZZ82775.1 23S rRNA (pseudouridine(1915)-N(3))-methyltransferase RlmH [Pseudoxanthomonas winnipegensis]TAA21709.1 23S rRNA (pseudouridine(1915)-N(3))-methyltransferase RlmH [Pseudoxanthomonas winnipegensis]TAA24934.1 23S rRNA (pseudouridine(1915)-N(3))-methyltransferase RlmH [Pseudoxanthomonas winnipegensis]TAA36532.1 23S rRNA (pseudouridine(1915)-N(3))-methyltransferase RlmH [Pseudoxanthomonas winnip
MKARLIATGERAPAWVAQGFAEYQKRLSHWLPFELVEVAPGLRGKHRDAQRAIEDEGQRVLAALPKGAHIVALEVTGKQHSSEQLAQRLEHWRGQGRDLAFLIGGPEGHSPDVLAAAHETWSLGPLTLPHMLARLLVAEQLYRAAAMLANHPYHRA